MKSTEQQDAGLEWQWQRGTVDVRGEHLRLFHGDPAGDAKNWREVARVGKPFGRMFTVELLAGEDDEAVRMALREIEFFLVGKGEPNPWNYACHHGTTAGNVYGSIHWNWDAGT